MYLLRGQSSGLWGSDAPEYALCLRAKWGRGIPWCFGVSQTTENGRSEIE